MPLFRKKPVVIEAVQLTWSNWSRVCDFVPRPWFVEGVCIDNDNKPLPEGCVSERVGLLMQTLESERFLAVENDWIIKGVNGEFYPCKPDIFEKTYEPYEDQEDIIGKHRHLVAKPENFTNPTKNSKDCICGAKGDPDAARKLIANCPCCDGVQMLVEELCGCSEPGYFKFKAIIPLNATMRIRCVETVEGVK